MEHMNLSKTVLGIELGSTRIKAVLLDECYIPIASGSYTWENQFIDGVWTYALSDAETGLQTCFAELKADFEQKYAQKLTMVGSIGISAMMHGYLPFDKDGIITPYDIDTQDRCDLSVLVMPVETSCSPQKPIWNNDFCVKWRGTIYRMQEKT